jgi:hypothetical protein
MAARETATASLAGLPEIPIIPIIPARVLALYGATKLGWWPALEWTPKVRQ